MQTQPFLQLRNTNGPAGQALVRCKLFADMEKAALQQILQVAEVKRLGPKTNIVFSGDRPESLYLLRTGKARSYALSESGTEILLLWIVPGDAIGLVSLLPNPPSYLASAMTISECEFLVWDHSTIRRLAKAYPQLTENGLRVAVHYLQIYMKRHADIINKKAESRLAETLLHLATHVGELRPSGIAIDITNEQLSSLSDISSFTASRFLSKWERQGALCKERGRVTLLAPESLMVV
jgi:CRP-like cAMP-binding protein